MIMMTKLPSGYPMMTKLITKDDPLYFSQTSNESYDRHHYKLVFKEKYVILKTWEEVQEYWWNKKAFENPVIEVIDKPQPKKGFK